MEYFVNSMCKICILCPTTYIWFQRVHIPCQWPSQNTNLEQESTPSTHKVATKEIGMEEMLDAFFDMETLTKAQNQSSIIPKQQATSSQPHQNYLSPFEHDNKGEMMATLTKIPLYN